MCNVKMLACVMCTFYHVLCQFVSMTDVKIFACLMFRFMHSHRKKNPRGMPFVLVRSLAPLPPPCRAVPRGAVPGSTVTTQHVAGMRRKLIIETLKLHYYERTRRTGVAMQSSGVPAPMREAIERLADRAMRPSFD